jgi:multidrug resistance efflux pump
MITRYLLPLLSILGVCFAAYTVMGQNKTQPILPPTASPASSPYESQVPGAGLVEPSTEFISIGANVPGIVTRVFAKTGDRVKQGDPLFSIDDRSLRSELAVREATVAAAQVGIEKLIAMPRTEEIPPAEARLREAESQVADLNSQLAMWEKADRRAVSEEELSKRRFGVLTAQTRVAQARADLDLLRAGAWKPDLEIARANLASAQTEVARTRTEIERLTVRAPVDAQILKINIRAGEYAPSGGGGGAGGAGSPDSPLMIIGGTDTLHIRVDIDENDAWRVKPGTEGFAYIRGNSSLRTPIAFVRFEPYVIPKRSLTGASGERVDTRVLQIICAFKPTALAAPVYVGQQMDVFLAAPALGDAKFGADAEQARKDLKGAKP